MASATDRVGNKGKADKNRFDLTVDTLAPWVSEARTGISYDVDDNEEIRDRSYIALTFVNDEDGTVEDSIAASTLDVRDFIIAGYEVLDIIQPELLDDEKKDGEYKVKDAKSHRHRFSLRGWCRERPPLSRVPEVGCGVGLR